MATGALPDSDSDRNESSSASEPVTMAWRCVSASVRGVSHERAGTCCQDAHAWTFLPGGAFGAAVADGAGSAAHSEIGAYTATSVALKEIERLVDASGLPDTADAALELLEEVLRVATGGVISEADEQGLEPKDLASTLILALVTPDRIAVLQVGDGAVVVQWSDGKLEAITSPVHGEYINETVFLTSLDAALTAQLAVREGEISGVAIFTDGLQPIALTGVDNVPHPPFFRPLFQFAAASTNTDASSGELGAFLGSPRLAQRTDDDLTLVLAVINES